MSPQTVKEDALDDVRPPRKRKAVTIFEVAQHAKVAPSTVSLVTNGNGFVSEETRKAVEQAIRQLGYKPRGRGRKTAATTARPIKSLDIIVIYVQVKSGPLPMTASTLGAIEGINHAFGVRRMRPSLMAAADRVADDVVLLSSLSSRQVDGAILIGMGMEDRGYAQQLYQANVPLMLVGCRPTHQAISSVTADYYHGSRQATQHLLDLGHRRIGFAGWDSTHWATTQRYLGYQDALKASDLKAADPLYTHGMTSDALHNALTNYFQARLDEGYTAFAVGDSLAKLAVPTLEALGRHVPGDVSIVGFDNLGLTVGQRDLNLTSVGYDQRYLGEMAVQTLLDVIESAGRTRSINRTIDTRFVPGQTTAAAPG